MPELRLRPQTLRTSSRGWRQQRGRCAPPLERWRWPAGWKKTPGSLPDGHQDMQLDEQEEKGDFDVAFVEQLPEAEGDADEPAQDSEVAPPSNAGGQACVQKRLKALNKKLKHIAGLKVK